MGFLELSEKIINPIHFIPGIYPYGVSLLMTVHFHVPSLMFLADFKHDVKEVYWSDVCFSGCGLRSSEFHGDW